MEYQEFLKRKELIPQLYGVNPGIIHEKLYPFQRAITEWAIRRGRAAIFADCGLGKTLMQIEWAKQSGNRVLIVAPLSVAEQTIREADSLDIEIKKVSSPSEDKIQITNYQKLHKFLGYEYDAIVLDESSILKSLDGKTRTMLIRDFSHIPRRLCCTATPAPNDLSEIANHSEFLGIMPRNEMLATFFVHDSNGKTSSGYRIKGHAQDVFWKWMSTWAIYLCKPSDLGFKDDGFILPAINIEESMVAPDWRPDGMLFAGALGGIKERRDARRGTIASRINRAIEIINSDPGQWLVWCGLNQEATLLHKELNGTSVNIEGATDDDKKVEYEYQWRTGNYKTLITKPSIFGFGMNWQHCHNMIFLGLGDSYEQYYQSIRRCLRFGQSHNVRCVIITSEQERDIVENVKRKESTARSMADGIIANCKESMSESIHGIDNKRGLYMTTEVVHDNYTLMMGDSIERIKEIETGKIGLSVFSPPFASLYTYSSSERDMGNSKNYDEFFKHFNFLIPELLRITQPGRRCLVHCQQISTLKSIHGIIGWRDFRADIVRNFVASEWVYDGEVVIDKDPQAQAIRTKSKALMFVQKNKDSSWCRPAMADYILCFRHPGDNISPIIPDVTNEEWICWARPIWYGIRESDTLNFTSARTDKDERHICPLQLGTIERCIRLWSNQGDIVFSPFAGIGSEGYVSLQHNRKFIGIELKQEYYQQAIKNLENATKQGDLFYR